MNIGFIGVGRHAERAHLKPLLKIIDKHQIVAIADISDEHLETIADKYELNAQRTIDWRDVVYDDSVDVVYIMTPDEFHTQQLVTTVQAGKHVFCEKPLADNLHDYQELSEAFISAQEQGLVVASCHPRRFDPPWITVRKYIADRELLAHTFGLFGDLGKVIAFDVRLNYHKPSKSGLHQSFSFDHLCHEIDAANFFFGMSELKIALNLADSATNYAVSAIRTDGIELSFRGIRALDEHIYQEDLRIDFEQGSLAMDVYSGVATLRRGGALASRELTTFQTDYDERFMALNAHVVRAILGEESLYLTEGELRLNTLAAIKLHDTQNAISINS